MSSPKRSAKKPLKGSAADHPTDIRWRMALESAGDGMWNWDVKSDQVQYSDQWKKMLGYQPHEIRDEFTEWRTRVHPDDLAGVMEQVRAHLARRSEAYSVEFRMRCKDGSWKWILARGMVTGRDAQGNPLHVIGTHTDTSAWRLAQQRESGVLRLILQGTPKGQVFDTIVHGVEATRPGLVCCLLLKDEKNAGWRVAAGPNLPRAYRKVLDGMKSTPAGALGRVLHAGRRVVTREIAKAAAWRPHHEACANAGLASCWTEPVRSGDGTLLGSLACFHRFAHVPGAAETAAVEAAAQFVALTIDHYQALSSLRRNEERYSMAIQGSRDGLWDWNLRTDDLYVSQRYKEMLGYKDGELPSSRKAAFLSRLHPEDLERVEKVHEAHFKRHKPYEVDFRLRTKSGSYKWFTARGKARRDSQGRPTQMTGTISDIDDRKRAEENLIQSQRFNQTVLDQTTALILVMDATGRFTHVNKAFVSLLGYPLKKLIGRNPWEVGLLDPEEVPRSMERFQNILLGQKSTATMLRAHARDGRILHVEIRSTLLRHPDGTVDKVIITGSDITERRRLEQEVIRVAEEEQATIGHNLHDGVGQTLTGIYSLVQMLESGLQGDSKQSASRISELIQQAIAEVRRMSHGLSPLSVRHRGLHGGLRLLAETISKDFRVRTLCEIDAEVRLHNHEHEANLYRIAQEAVNNALHHGKPALIQIKLMRTSHTHAVLSIKDDGGGFRKKEFAAGNGIGLRVMGYRASLIGGELKIDSRPRRGVTITCRFPCPPSSTA